MTGTACNAHTKGSAFEAKSLPPPGDGTAPRSGIWASPFAYPAPPMHTPIPGPASLALMSRRDRYEFGEFSWVTGLPVGFSKGRGVTLDDVDGNRYIDLTHGHCAAGLGHGNPEISDAID